MICADGLVRATRFSLVIEGGEYKGVANQVTNYTPPSITQESVTQPTPKRDIPWPGTKIDFGDLTVSVLMSGGMANVKAIYGWMKANQGGNEFHDIVVLGYASNDTVVFQQRFKDCFPEAMQMDAFDTTNAADDPLRFTVTFKFADMEFV